MSEYDQQIEELVRAWVLAGQRLGIRVNAPYDLQVGATSVRCIACLPDFGGPNGMVLQATFPPNFAIDEVLERAAQKAGYYISFINPNSYTTHDLSEFQCALKDWGYYGSREVRPAWLSVST
jgi:hypothetical protein